MQQLNYSTALRLVDSVLLCLRLGPGFKFREQGACRSASLSFLWTFRDTRIRNAIAQVHCMCAGIFDKVAFFLLASLYLSA